MTQKRKITFNFPPRPPMRKYRQKTKRAKLIALLNRPQGATFDEIQEDIGWTYRVAFDNVKLLNDYVGFGLSEGEDGRIRIHA